MRDVLVESETNHFNFMRAHIASCNDRAGLPQIFRGRIPSRLNK